MPSGGDRRRPGREGPDARRPGRRARTARAGRAAAAALARAAAGLVLALALALMLAGCGLLGGTSHPNGRPGRPAGAAGGLRRFTLRGPRPGYRLGQGAISRVVRAGPGRGPRPVFLIAPGGIAGVFAGGVAQLAGTGPGGTGARPRISVGPIPPASSAQTITMPLNSYEQVASQQQDALQAASDLLVQRCMTSRGFSYQAAAQPGAGAAALQSVEEGYGVTSMSQAQVYGYGQPTAGPGAGPGPGAGAGPPVFVQQQQRHGSAWTSALLGEVVGARAGSSQRPGCLESAATELYGPAGSDANPDPVPLLTLQAAQWTQSDPRILAAERDWSRCMAGRGFTFSAPADAQGRNWPSTPTPAEIATAEADVSCKLATNLTNTWLTVEAAYQRSLTEQNLGALSALQHNFGVLLRRADTLLQIPFADPGAPVIPPGR